MAPRSKDTTHGDAPVERLQGSVERVTFHSEESGFCVLRIKVRGKRDLVTVVGSAAVITAGEYVECEGCWNNDRHHGLQFKAQQLHVVPPSTLEGIEKYLGSGMVKGIGPHFARKLVRANWDILNSIFVMCLVLTRRLLTRPTTTAIHAGRNAAASSATPTRTPKPLTTTDCMHASCCVEIPTRPGSMLIMRRLGPVRIRDFCPFSKKSLTVGLGFRVARSPGVADERWGIA